MRRIARTATVMLVSTAAAGCQTTGPGTMSALATRPTSPSPNGTGLHLRGRPGGRRRSPQQPTAVQPAVVAALDDLRIASVRQISDGGTIVFEGVTADDRKASVTLRPDPGGTRLVARVGLFGDQALSRALMDRVGIRLGTLPPAAVPAEPPSDPSPNPYFSRSAISDAEMLRDQAEAPYRATAVPDNRPY